MQRVLFYFLTIVFVCMTQMVYAKAVSLSLDEAILLAVRSNPNVQSSKLTEMAQKFNLHVQEWQFDPHYSFQSSATISRAGSNGQPASGLQVQPGVSLNTTIGTQLTLTSTSTQNSHFNTGLSLQVMQPLMRGFGSAVVEAALNNARDSEVISRLNIVGVLRGTISAVINAYLDVVSAERTVIIDQDALKRAEQSVFQTKLFIKAGHKAGNELVTVLATAASARSQLINDKNNLQQAGYALLSAIGIDPNSDVHFSSLDLPSLISRYRSPTLEQTKYLILQNDIQYQTDELTLHGSTKRSLLVAEDNTRWQLNLTASATTGNSWNTVQGSGFNNLFNSKSQGQSVVLALQIPIDDQLAKQGVMNAKIALKQADLALMQERWNKQTSAINGWNLVRSAERAMRFAEDAEIWQEKTYHVSYQKYLHGLIDSLELQSAQSQLIQAQQTKLSAEITYIKALVNLDLLIGNTLKTWRVQVRS